MQAPTATELLNHPAVRRAMEEAWVDSLPGDPFCADNGIYTTGPDSRRGGLTGEAGYPAGTTLYFVR